MPTLLRYAQAAEYIGISERMLRIAVTERRITCVKPSGRMGPTYFRPADLDTFIERCIKQAEVGPAAERRRSR